MTIIVFLLPPNAKEKIIFGGICLLLNGYFIEYVGSLTDFAPEHSPLIGKIYIYFLELNR